MSIPSSGLFGILVVRSHTSLFLLHFSIREWYKHVWSYCANFHVEYRQLDDCETWRERERGGQQWITHGTITSTHMLAGHVY